MTQLNPQMLTQSRRLAQVRAQWMQWCAREDTSTWEATFFFQVLDEKSREINRLRKALRRLRDIRTLSA